jgi:hypothetical protein
MHGLRGRGGSLHDTGRGVATMGLPTGLSSDLRTGLSFGFFLFFFVFDRTMYYGHRRDDGDITFAVPAEPRHRCS